MALTGDLIKEYLVGLGFQVDEKGLSNFNKAMDTAKKSALGIVGVLAAATTGIMKFIGSTYEKDKQLEKDAKAMRKTVEQTRAHTNALEVLGVTADQLKKDASLKSIYNELQEIGMAMALPEGSEGIDTIDNLMDSFRKLKLTATYALDWIGYQIKTVAAGPLQYFSGFMDRMQMSFQMNLPEISEWVGIAINAVLSFVEVILRIGEAVGQLLGRIPKPILAIGAAIAAVWAIIRAGPVGWISAAIVAVLLLLDDLFTYLDGGDALLGDFWGALIGWVQKGIAALKKLKPVVENVKRWFKDMFTGIRDESGNIDWTQLGQNIHNGIKSAFTSAGNWFKELILGEGGADADWLEVGEAILNGIKSAFSSFNTWLKGLLTGTDGEGVSWADVGSTIWGKIKSGFSKASDFLRGLFLGDSADDTSWSDVGEKMWNGIKSGFSDVNTWLKSLFTGGEEGDTTWSQIGKDIWAKITGALNKVTGEEAQTALTGLAGKIGEGIASALEAAKGLGSKVMSAIAKALGGDGEGGEGIAGTVTSAASALITPILNKLTEPGFISGLITNAGAILESIVNTIFKAEIGKVEGAGSILTQIIDAITSVDFEEIGGALVSVAGKIIDGIVTGFTKLTGAGAKIFGAIANSISDLDESGAGADIGTTLSSLAQKIIDGIATGLSSAEFQTLVENIGKGVIAAISFLGDIIGAFAGWLLSAEGLTALGNLGMAIWDAIWAGFIQVAKVGDKIADIFTPDFLKLPEEVEYESYGPFGMFSAPTYESMQRAKYSDSSDTSEWTSGSSSYSESAAKYGNPDKEWTYGSSVYREKKDEIEEEVTEIVIGKDATADEEAATAAGEQIITSATDAVKEKESELTDAAIEVIENTVQSMIDTLSEDQASSIAETFSEALMTAIEETYTSIMEIWEKFPDELKTIFNMARLRAVAAFQQIVGQMRTIATNVKGAFDDIPDHITSVFQRAADGAISAFSAVADQVASQVASINASIDSIGSGSGGDGSGKQAHTTTNAEGGVYDTPTTTSIAEGGKREYVIPAEKPQVAIPLLQSLLSDMGITPDSLMHANSMLGGSGNGNVTPFYAQSSTDNSSQETNTSNVTIDARSNISVTGNNPDSIGSSVARAMERRLVRNMRGRLVAP